MDVYSRQVRLELEKRYGSLNESLHDCMGRLSMLMMKKELIGRQAMLEKDYHAMMIQYMSAMDLMENVPQLERHCKKFLVILNNLGPLQTLEGENLKKAWQEAMDQCGYPHFLSDTPPTPSRSVPSSPDMQSLRYSKSMCTLLYIALLRMKYNCVFICLILTC